MFVIVAVVRGESRYSEEVGELDRTYSDLTNERNEMLIKLEGLKRRKQIEMEVRKRTVLLHTLHATLPLLPQLCHVRLPHSGRVCRRSTLGTLHEAISTDQKR